MLRLRMMLPAVAILLILSLLVSSLLSSAIGSSAVYGYSRVMVELAPDVSVEHAVQYLKSRYDIIPIDILSNVAHGVIAYIRSDQVEMLRHEGIVKRIGMDETIRIIGASQQLHMQQQQAEQQPFISPTSFQIIGLDRIQGMTDSYGRALTGEGIKVALIDTGVDYTHRDLYGYGRDGKVIAGYDFLEKDDDPLDVDGHGTAVAGIIAADGEMRGIAPKARLLAYKIASGSNYTSSLDIVRALERAARDGADIVNISIGMDRVNEDIDNAVSRLVRKGIVVVVAAGNSGQSGMGSPATAKDAITVGATMSAQSSMIAVLKINDLRFEAIPMLGSAMNGGDSIISGELVFANFATSSDVATLDLRGKIVLAERGGPVYIVNGVERREVVYFSDKERNVAEKGALALIVYNNEPGIFYGTLVHDNNSSDYRARIPVVSISREDGLKIREMLERGAVSSIELRILSKPDLVASFSSKGPASPFYIKPDIVAPGAGINSTSLNGSYAMNSGTSFAAPHVTGAAALLLQKYPDLRPEEVASLLITTAEPVTDLYDEMYPLDVAGSGRLALDRALRAEFVALPYNLMFYMNSGDPTVSSKSIMLRSLDQYRMDKDSISVKWIPSSHIHNRLDVEADLEIIDERNAAIHVRVMNDGFSGGERYEGRLMISNGTTTLLIPVSVYINPMAIHARNSDGMLILSLDDTEGWKSARIRVTDTASMKSRVVTLTPESSSTGIPVLNTGEYWIDASVITSSGTMKVLSTLEVNSVNNGIVLVEQQPLPIRELFIIMGFVGVVVVIALVISRRNAGYDSRDDFISDSYNAESIGKYSHDGSVSSEEPHDEMTRIDSAQPGPSMSHAGQYSSNVSSHDEYGYGDNDNDKDKDKDRDEDVRIGANNSSAGNDDHDASNGNRDR